MTDDNNIVNLNIIEDLFAFHIGFLKAVIISIGIFLIFLVRVTFFIAILLYCETNQSCHTPSKLREVKVESLLIIATQNLTKTTMEALGEVVIHREINMPGLQLWKPWKPRNQP